MPQKTRNRWIGLVFISMAISIVIIDGTIVNTIFPSIIVDLDELIDNGLDASGVEGALSVLKKMARERNKNVYLISHKDELVGRVNNVLKVIKENGFTSYSNDLDIVE